MKWTVEGVRRNERIDLNKSRGVRPNTPAGSMIWYILFKQEYLGEGLDLSRSNITSENHPGDHESDIGDAIEQGFLCMTIRGK